MYKTELKGGDFANKHKSFIFTGNKYLCTGCGACTQVCNHNALKMSPDNEGFLYPNIDKEKCVECGLCEKVCPVAGTKTENQYDNQRCYVATTKHEEYYMESASIGICTMLSEYVLSNGGCVFGVCLDENNWTAYHIAVESADDLSRIRNSKYLQSDTKNTFSDVKSLLNNGKTVLYIGTPCQIAGLKSFLRKSYNNLYTIDLICHGVFSPMLMPYEVKYWEEIFKGRLFNFRFRSKRVYRHSNGGMVNFDLEKNGKTIHIERFAGSSPTYRCYAYSGDGFNYNQRPSCYTCHFRAEKRYADLTVGDPWFIDNKIIKNSLLTTNSIRSLYSVNTEQGEKLVEHIKQYLIEEELNVSDAFCQPATKSEVRQMPKARKELFACLKTEEYGSLVERLLNCDLKKAHQRFHRKYQLSCIKRRVKEILKWK